MVASKEIKEIKKNIERLSALSKEDFLEEALIFLDNSRSELKNLDYVAREKRLKGLLPEAYAFAYISIYLVSGKKLRDVQLLGAVSMNSGKISEMKTGEGKTLTFVLPAYLNALTGDAVHVATTNEYLSKRDFLETEEIYSNLGLMSAYVPSGVNIKKEAKREAYMSDVTYASISTLAFDYLNDEIAPSEEDIVKLKENNYLLIDEADDIMIDTALTPFVITKNSEEDKTYNDSILKEAKIANKIVGAIYDEVKKNPSLLYECKSEDEYDYLVNSKINGIKVNLQGDDKKRILENVLIIKSVDNEYFLTDKAYKYSSFPLLKSFLEERLGRNVSFSNYLDYLERSPELNKVAGNLEIKNINEGGVFFNNALKAYFGLEKDKDYVLKNNGKESEVSILINGRVASGRHYAEGLQIAVELKEDYLNKYRSKYEKIKISKDYSDTSEITMASFLKTYKKTGGATGTVPKESFKLIYDLESEVIPTYRESLGRRKKDSVIDRGRFITYSDRYKYEALLREVEISRKESRPILISTTNLMESEKVYDFLRYYISGDISLINANTEDEALKVAEAGKKGRVTIITEMSGRGTDIKLGGEDRDSLIERKILEEKKNYVNMAKNIMTRKGMNWHDGYETYYEDKFDNERRSIIKKHLEEVTPFTNNKNIHDKLNELGGIKLIMLGVFPSKRTEDQVKGRVGRGLDNGEIVSIASLPDLKNSGITLDPREIESLKKRRVIYDEKINKLIENKQARNEKIKATIIFKDKEEEKVINELRTINKDRYKEIRGADSFDSFLDEEIDKIISLAKEESMIGTYFSPRLFTNYFKENYEIEFSFKNIKTYRESAKLAFLKKIEDIRELMGDNYNEEIKKFLLGKNKRLWDNFMYNSSILRKNHLNTAFLEGARDLADLKLINSLYKEYYEIDRGLASEELKEFIEREKGKKHEREERHKGKN